VKRTLSGSFSHLAPGTLLRLLSATQPSGELELESGAGSLQLRVVLGRMACPGLAELRRALPVLTSTEGSFRFNPGPPDAIPGDSMALADYLAAARACASPEPMRLSSDVDVNQLLEGKIADETARVMPPSIHMLPTSVPENPIGELAADLEEMAPEELLFAQVGVLATDPRPWRGTLEASWRRRGWQLRLFGDPSQVPVGELDVLVVHQLLSVSRVGHEDAWTDLVARSAGADRPVPVIWIGPLGDAAWVQRLIEAGTSFLLPPPQGLSGEPLQRFLSGLTVVVERQVRAGDALHRAGPARAVSQLVELLLHGVAPEDALSSLLEVVAGHLLRGAVFRVEETAIRCRAGFGYPLERGTGILPRGVGLVERVVRSGESVVGVEPDAAGVRQLGRALGVDGLPQELALIPLGAGGRVTGVLVGDREGASLNDIEELELLGQRFGGVVF